MTPFPGGRRYRSAFLHEGPLFRHLGVSLLLLLVVSCKGSETPTSSEPPPEARGSGTSNAKPAVEPINPVMLTKLLKALRTAAFPADLEALLTGERVAAQEDPNWPTLTYLVGEAHRQRGDSEKARQAFRELASWAVANDPGGPYKDAWGGSGLAVLGLWRWLQILDEHGSTSPEEVNQVLDIASKLQATRFYSGIVQPGLLPALLFLQEDVAKRLAHVAWKHQRPEATSLFLDFLTIDSVGEPDTIDKEIKDKLLTGGLVDPNRMDLFRAMRSLSLVKTRQHKEQAAGTLKRLWEDRRVPADARAEAGYEWAYLNRMDKDRRQEIVAILTEVIELSGARPLAEKALYFRGTVYNYDQPHAMKNPDAFRADMKALLDRFPQSRLADDALYQLATEYLFEPDLDRALPYYAQLRSFQGVNDYQDSAYYLPALGLVGRRREGDLNAANRLLEEYAAKYGRRLPTAGALLEGPHRGAKERRPGST